MASPQTSAHLTTKETIQCSSFTLFISPLCAPAEIIAFDDRAEEFKKPNCQVHWCFYGFSFLLPGIDQHTQETRRTRTHEQSFGIRPQAYHHSGLWSLRGLWRHLVQGPLYH
ncbi:unnamed protein product [Gulo gulo]|uniref:Uncharacterized protein n=1 Tax=Gulo gulo TaxID=48420 RepID=A0A9X9LQU2_GULGU|nr:unnamed protein product [Gulo gulo]